MRILSHYFAARFLGLFLTVLAASLLFLATIELVLNGDEVSAFVPVATDAASHTTLADPTPAGAGTHGTGPSNRLLASVIGGFRFLGIRLTSYYLTDLVPIASFVAAFFVVAWAGRTLEMLAVQASGIRLARVILPILATAGILSLATAILHETVVLRAQQAWIQTTRSPDEAVDLGRLGLWHQQGRTFTRISLAETDSRILHDVEVFERGSSGRVVRVVRAERVRIGDTGSWVIEDARIWHFDEQDPRQLPRVEEHAYLELDSDLVHGEALLEADASILPIRELAAFIASQPDKANTARLRLQRRLHERLTSPWLVLLFAGLALPFALRIDESGHFVRPALEATALLGVFFLLRSAGTGLVHQGFVPAAWPPWITIGIFATWGTWALARARI